MQKLLTVDYSPKLLIDKISAFTLAEVLITLTIIGVVAALTIPQLVNNITDYSFAKAQTVAFAKITEATNQMKSSNDLDGYTKTTDFVDVFQKYIKVAKRCPDTALTQCFAPKIKTANGTEINVTTLNRGAVFGLDPWNTPTVGLALANGPTMIVSYISFCPRIEPENNTTPTTSCLSLIYDTNGLSPPNILGKDIQSINSTLGLVKVGGLTVAGSDIIMYSTLNTCSGGTAADKAYDPTGDSNTKCASNTWAYAKRACALFGQRLPTVAELSTIYANRAVLGTFDKNTYYWSSEELDASTGRSWSMGAGVAGSIGKDFWDKIRCVE